MEQIRQLLSQLGFSKHEIISYCGILQLGEATILEISKFTGLKRPTLYNTVKVLVNKGLVTQVLTRKKSYSITSIDAIKDLIHRQQQAYFSTLPSLLALQNVPRGTKPEIRYYDGLTQIDNVYHTLYPLLNQGHILYTAAAMRDLLRVMPKTINEFDVLAIKNQWSIQELLPMNKVSLEYSQANKNYQRKFMPSGTDLYDQDFMIIDDLVVIVSAGHVPYAIGIRDKSLAASFRSLFQALWKSL